MMKGVEAIISMLHTATMPERKHQDTENQRLRAAYLTPAWDTTNTAFDAFVLGLFNDALAPDSSVLDAKWPRGDRFREGAERIVAKHLPELEGWLKQQRAGGSANAATEMQAESDGSDSDGGAAEEA
jgi:hypothetical protein